MEQTETDNRKAHYRAGRKSHSKTAIKPLYTSVCRPCICCRCNLHTDKSGKTRQKSAGDKGNRNKPRKQSERRHNSEYYKHRNKEYRNNTVLAFKICIRALTYRRRYLCHFFVSNGKAKHFF